MTTTAVLPAEITETQWAEFQDRGCLRLGTVLPREHLGALQGRIDDIMLGKAEVPYDQLLMQLDSSSGVYEDAGQQSHGFKKATLDYRKIQNLEIDPLFRAYMALPLYKDLCARAYGAGTPIAAFRAMFMNKPANRGTFLPFHQDRWSDLDRDPVLTVWTALDPATVENGCVQVVPGSHKLGLINPSHPSGFLSKEQARDLCTPDRIEHVELNSGEAVLLHNWLLHGSDINRSAVSRRAFSVCYMDARTVSRRGEVFPVIFE